jgi:outer membrane lipoprotein-sorting protein
MKLALALTTCSTVVLLTALAAVDGASTRPTGSATSSPASAPASTQPAIPPAEAEPILKDLRAKLETVKTIQANFVQEKDLAVFKHKLVIRGHFAVERPKRLAWHVASPVKYSVSVSGDDVRFWDEDTNKPQTITIGPKHSFRAAFEQFQGWFIGDYRSLEDSYDVVLQSKDPLVVHFAPKPTSPMVKIIKGVEVTFRADRLALESFVFHEGGGDTTTIRFTDTQINKPVPESVWEVPPESPPHER